MQLLLIVLKYLKKKIVDGLRTLQNMAQTTKRRDIPKTTLPQTTTNTKKNLFKKSQSKPETPTQPNLSHTL